MRNRVRLFFCLIASLLVSPVADAQEKSKKFTSNTSACAISIPDMTLDSIAKNMPTVRLALCLEHTIPLWNAGKLAELEALYKKAILEARQLQGANSISEAALQQELGDLYIKKGNYKGAEPAYKRCIKIIEMPPYTKSHREILAECYEGMGYVYENGKQYQQALDAFRKCVTIMDAEGELRKDPNSEKYAMGLDRVAAAYIKLNNFKAAEPLLKRSLEMRKKTYGENGYVTSCVKERLAKIYEGLGNSQEITKINNALIQSKIKELGPVLGQFYLQCTQKVSANESILPLSTALGPGAQWNQALFTKEIQKKLGANPADVAWYKIPNWYAGLWGDIPKGVKVKETDGALWTDPPPMGFYSGPGPFATRNGFVRARDGWWHYDASSEQTTWTQSGDVNTDTLIYMYIQNLVPFTMSDGSIKCKAVVLNFEVRPKVKVDPLKFSELFPPATIVNVWQENRFLIYQQLEPNKYAVYSAERLYDFDGKELSISPQGRKVGRVGNASWQKKCGEAAAINFKGRNLKQELKQFLTRRKLFEEIKALQ